MSILHPAPPDPQAVTLSGVIATLPLLACALATAEPDAPAVELPDGPAAVAWAGVGQETAPAPLGGSWLAERTTRAAGGADDPLEVRWLAWARWRLAAWRAQEMASTWTTSPGPSPASRSGR